MAWGIVFGVATSVLRFLVGIDQLPPTTTLTFRTLNEASYLAVVAVAIAGLPQDRKSTRLNSSHGYISYAVFCLKKKKKYIGYTHVKYDKTIIGNMTVY